jgi:hypothetical protein
MIQLLVTANVAASTPNLFPLIMGAVRSSEASVLTRVTRSNIPGDDILHNHRGDNLKSYIALKGWAPKRRRNVSCELQIRSPYPRRRHSSNILWIIHLFHGPPSKNVLQYNVWLLSVINFENETALPCHKLRHL